ncbi:MAG: Mu-like prophage major head subunit gpT family protein [Thermomonas sp.]|uniref:Mu-like prophage major head subunit gpT family protein n=1 Tax=Thermomonas sp. TaxID=1971895 RepID=UPI00262A4864|nr:Mu-like prophage major head subunit gpT family protein [Thermomonas sp.]MCC7097274.1 Mu-like prophage major head subunit gpT family protein [Thermomonas sp.]
MILNAENLNALRLGNSTAMRKGAGGAPAPLSPRIASTVPSSQKEQRYGWLGKMPRIREWVGGRVVQNISEGDYAIKEKKFELTIGVDRDDIETDNLGHYALLFEGIGEATVLDPEQLIWDLLKAGFTTPCYDGQYFFDTDHPVLDANGAVTSVANTDGGAGTPWFLLDVSRALKPLIKQVRRDFGDLVARDKVTDDNVFDFNEFRYGVDARMNFGYGFWQQAWGSKQALNAANYGAARAAMGSMKGDYGRPLGIKPNLLVVPPSLESAGLKLLNSEYAAGGETNEWKGTAELLVVPWLA